MLDNETIMIPQVAVGFRSSFFLTSRRQIFYSGVLSDDKTVFDPTKFNMVDKNVEIS